jgi:hypothetical protein
MEEQCAFCDVGTGYLSITQMKFMLKGVNRKQFLKISSFHADNPESSVFITKNLSTVELKSIYKTYPKSVCL